MIIKNLGREAIKRLNNPLMRFQTAHIKNEMRNHNYFTKKHISFTRIYLTHYLEDYYTTPEIATNMISPMSEYVWWGWLILQAVIVFGTLFHSNYYFTGKALPKVQGNSQLCEDSW
ncbi:conserved Plasmodium protein, unknown function [Plasmodium relictum]|uniref:Uncharacterized protein n=1 Tax=Plasmodium relictum TaxID=85471 RepID=A0A1J1H6U0_PLARL|nr:conserved Plasmodium protein, unknown function [Plasmodium relictum]CRG99149.1 conserved Plasmodium protein, unknown function [Plasmodium relictum]